MIRFLTVILFIMFMASDHAHALTEGDEWSKAMGVMAQNEIKTFIDAEQANGRIQTYTHLKNHFILLSSKLPSLTPKEEEWAMREDRQAKFGSKRWLSVVNKPEYQIYITQLYLKNLIKNISKAVDEAFANKKMKNSEAYYLNLIITDLNDYNFYTALDALVHMDALPRFSIYKSIEKDNTGMIILWHSGFARQLSHMTLNEFLRLEGIREKSIKK